MRCEKSAGDCCGANISQRDATIFLLFVDLIISALCVFLFVTTYFCRPSDEEFNQNNWFLCAFLVWHASKLVIVSLGIVGAFKDMPSYLIPYICYWGLLTAFLLLYSLFVVILSFTNMKNIEHYADPSEVNETSTSNPRPIIKIQEPTNVPQLVLEYSLNNVALIAIILIIVAAFSGYFTIVVHEFYKSLKKTEMQVADQPEVIGLPSEP